MSDPVWEELMKVGKKIEKSPIQHTMTEDQLYDTLGTIDYIVPNGVADPMRLNAQWEADMGRGANVQINHINTGESFIRNISPKFRLFDELGMAMGGRLGDDEDTIHWAKTLAKAYIACVKDVKVKNRQELYDCIPRQALKVNK